MSTRSFCTKFGDSLHNDMGNMECSEQVLWDHKTSTVDEIWKRAVGLAIDFMDAGLLVHDP